MKGGKLYYDMPIGILCLESLFPKPRGHMRNPLTYRFPTVTRVIRGVDIPRLLFNPTPDLLEPFIQAAKELEADGVQAITGSCGFMARFQNQIAAELHVSESYLIRIFRRRYQTTPHRCLTLLRLEQAQRLMRYSDLSLEAISLECGFRSYANFYKAFCAEKGENPAAVLKRLR